MTTTNVFQGLNTEAKSSSRVIRPPGGASSLSLGFGYEEEKPKAAPQPDPMPEASPAAEQKEEHKTGEAAAPQTPEKSEDAFVAGKPTPKTNEFNPITGVGSEVDSSTPNSRARGSRDPGRNPITGASVDDGEASHKKHFQKNAGSFNIITGEGYDAEAAKPVRQPPGGKSSGIF